MGGCRLSALFADTRDDGLAKRGQTRSLRAFYRADVDVYANWCAADRAFHYCATFAPACAARSGTTDMRVRDLDAWITGQQEYAQQRSSTLFGIFSISRWLLRRRPLQRGVLQRRDAHQRFGIRMVSARTAMYFDCCLLRR